MRVEMQFGNRLVDESNGNRFEKVVHFAIAVGERVEPNANFVQQRQVQVGQRGRFFVLDMPSAPQIPGGTACHDDRQIDVIMHVRVTHAAAIHVKDMVQ